MAVEVILDEPAGDAHGLTRKGSIMIGHLHEIGRRQLGHVKSNAGAQTGGTCDATRLAQHATCGKRKERMIAGRSARCTMTKRRCHTDDLGGLQEIGGNEIWMVVAAVESSQSALHQQEQPVGAFTFERNGVGGFEHRPTFHDAVEILAQAREGFDYGHRRDGVEITTLIETDFDMREGLQPSSEPGFGLANTFGDGPELAVIGRQDHHNPIGIAKWVSPQHDAVVLFHTHGANATPEPGQFFSFDRCDHTCAMSERLETDRTLARIFGGFRFITALWLTVLALFALQNDQPPPATGIVIAIITLAWVFAFLTWRTARNRPETLATMRWMFTDLAIGLITLIVPLFDAADGVNYGAGYPIASVVLWGYVGGISGGLVAAVLAGVVIALSGEYDFAGKVTTSLIYVVAAVVAGWGQQVFERSERARRRAEKALREERAARVRADERAEIASRVHDSVLQTLALIQRNSDEPDTVSSLARRQERVLRDQLFGVDRRVDGTLGSAIRKVAADIEDAYHVGVEVVTVGDAPMTSALEALVAAAREGLTNSAKHSGQDRVDLFAEIRNQRAHVFVRDRGPGFDLRAIGPDRKGITESIIGRMERYGGSAEFHSGAGVGTELELSMRVPGETV